MAEQIPPAVDEIILVDAHAHLHACFDRAAFLEGALENFARAAHQAALGCRWRACLLLAETRGETLSREAFEGRIPNPGGGWTLEPARDPLAVVARRAGGGELILIGGRQLTSLEGIEVLGLTAFAEIDGDLPLERLVEALDGSGAVPVVPWGFGKWRFARGRAVERLLRSRSRPMMFLGDNAGRPARSFRPSLFALAAELGVLILPGSDPLPLPWEARRGGRYGFVLHGRLDSSSPVESMRRLLRSLRSQPPSFGRLENPGAFLRNVAAMQARRLLGTRARSPEVGSGGRSP